MQNSVLNLAFNLARRYVFKGLLYSETWEDYDIDKKSLAFKSSDIILCITSGGSFALNSAIENPKEIYSVDSNKVQGFMLEIKLAAIKKLDYDSYWKFLTQKNSNGENLRIYKDLREELSTEARQYFDANKAIIRNGILNNGMLHFALNILNRYMRLTVGKSLINRLFHSATVAEQAVIYHKNIEKRLWNIFSNNLTVSSMLLYGVSPAQVDLLMRNGIKNIRQLYKKQLANVFTNTLLRDNFFWTYILLKTYSAKAAPPYLQRANFSKLRRGIKAIKLINDDALIFLRQQPDDSISKFSLSDILDWNTRQAQDIISESVRVGKKNAILTFRSELDTFRAGKKELVYHHQESQALSQQEKTGSYRGYFKYSVRKKLVNTITVAEATMVQNNIGL